MKNKETDDDKKDFDRVWVRWMRRLKRGQNLRKG